MGVTAQDQQSRAVIAAWNAQADEHNQWETLGDDEKIEWAMKAARALRAGMEPVAKIHKGKLTWSIPWPEYSVDTALLSGTHDLFTAAQVQAMGRAPLTDEQIEQATGAKRGEPLFLVAKGFTVAIEAAHGITHPTGD